MLYELVLVMYKAKSNNASKIKRVNFTEYDLNFVK